MKEDPYFAPISPLSSRELLLLCLFDIIGYFELLVEDWRVGNG